MKAIYDLILEKLIGIKAILENLFNQEIDQRNLRLYIEQLGRLSVLSELVGTKDSIACMDKGRQKRAIELAREISRLLDSDLNPYKKLQEEPRTMIEALERMRVCTRV